MKIFPPQQYVVCFKITKYKQNYLELYLFEKKPTFINFVLIIQDLIPLHAMPRNIGTNFLGAHISVRIFKLFSYSKTLIWRWLFGLIQNKINFLTHSFQNLIYFANIWTLKLGCPMISVLYSQPWIVGH